MEVVAANLLDLNALRKLEKACFDKDAWPLLDLIAVLTLPDVIRLKAMEGDQMVGFVAGDPRRSEGWGWIATIAVHPHYRRRGIGRELLHICEGRLGVANARLTVRTSNMEAIAMYNADGYQTIDIWKAYYSDGEDAQVMEKQLQ